MKFKFEIYGNKLFCNLDSNAGHGANKLTAAALLRHDAVLGDTDDAHPVSMDRDRCCQLTRNEGGNHRLNKELDFQSCKSLETGVAMVWKLVLPWFGNWYCHG